MFAIGVPDPLDLFLATFASFLDARHADLLEPLFLGTLLAHGRRTATAWFRAGDFTEEFRRGWTLLGTLAGQDNGPDAVIEAFTRKHTANVRTEKNDERCPTKTQALAESTGSCAPDEKTEPRRPRRQSLFNG